MLAPIVGGSAHFDSDPEIERNGGFTMTANSNGQSQVQTSHPYPGLQSLERLVGTWDVSGPDIQGQVVFEWMEGGFFLMQQVDFIHGGHPIKGIEIIGYEREFGATEPSQHIKSRWFDNGGNSFTYTYEVDEETLTIWGGEKGSPAYYRGRWRDDGNTNAGSWVYPGGGYASTMTRAKPSSNG